MRVLVNGDETDVEARQTLEGIVATIASDRRGVAAAVNGEVVPRSEWPLRELAAGDKVEVLSAIGGG